MEDKTKWFADCGWGVFCHYLGAAPSSDGGKELTADAWNRQVDGFDVDGLADQLAMTGASYFFITIGQNSGHYLAPNETYDNYVGHMPSKCSRRDLISDLYDVLQPRGIDLLVYLPSGAPAADPIAVERLGWEWGFEGSWPHSWGTRRTGKRLSEFQEKWKRIIRDWSLRWKSKVRGWWIDGCYFADEMYRYSDPPNFQSLVNALNAGNPSSIVAFNPGVLTPVISHTEYEDYTAGEISNLLPDCPGPWIERNGKRIRYHILSYLGETWCKGTPRFPDELVVGYTKHVTSKQGVITWDVPIQKNGLIPDAFMQQLTKIGKSVR